MTHYNQIIKSCDKEKIFKVEEKSRLHERIEDRSLVGNNMTQKTEEHL